jgi:ABC-type nitrate/sulfonate/bicarbonate transport system substrate-binding protein
VRATSLTFYCTTCLPGYHLPYLAAATNGLFAEHGLEVELRDPDGGPENIRRVAEGDADFCLTSVAHYLRATERFGPLAARFVGVVVQRSPMAALVRADSAFHAPADLAGARLGGPADKGLVLEYQASLDELGVARSTLVDMDYREAWDALARGDVDAVADFVDIVPRVRRLAGVEVRAIPFGIEAYSSGLVAADRVPLDRVVAMREAMVAALERQRRNPEEGVEQLTRRYPEIEPAAAVEGWSLGVPNIFTDAPTGSMDADRWLYTLRFLGRAYGLTPPDPETVYRPELAELPVH